MNTVTAGNIVGAGGYSGGYSGGTIAGGYSGGNIVGAGGYSGVTIAGGYSGGNIVGAGGGSAFGRRAAPAMQTYGTTYGTAQTVAAAPMVSNMAYGASTNMAYGASTSMAYGASTMQTMAAPAMQMQTIAPAMQTYATQQVAPAVQYV